MNKIQKISGNEFRYTKDQLKNHQNWDAIDLQM
jgi:hypothetical protein